MPHDFDGRTRCNEEIPKKLDLDERSVNDGRIWNGAFA
jgi:hypothetical protein